MADEIIRIIATGVLSGVPVEIQVIPYGSHETDKGDFVLDEEAAAAVMAAYGRRKNDMVIDYEHQTLGGSEAPAAGWIKRLVNKGKDGIWAVVEWTDRAAGYLANREYRYLSPVFYKRKSDGRVTRLINAALTNQPAIDGMVPVVNKAVFGREERTEVSEMKELLELLGLKAGATEEQARQAVMAMKALLDGVLKELGLDQGVTLEAAREAVAAMKAPAVPVEVIEALGLSAGVSMSEITGTIMAMKQGAGQAGELGRQIAGLRARLDSQDAEAMVAQAMKEGKITPAQKDWAMGYAVKDPGAFKVFVAKAPRVVPLGETAPAGGGQAPAGFDSAEDEMIARQLGVTGEQRKKFGPKPGEEVA